MELDIKSIIYNRGMLHLKSILRHYLDKWKWKEIETYYNPGMIIIISMSRRINPIIAHHSFQSFNNFIRSFNHQGSCQRINYEITPSNIIFSHQSKIPKSYTCKPTVHISNTFRKSISTPETMKRADRKSTR